MKKLLFVFLFFFCLTPFAFAETEASTDIVTTVINPFKNPTLTPSGHKYKVLLGVNYRNTNMWGFSSRGTKNDLLGDNLRPTLLKNDCDIVYFGAEHSKLLLDKGYADFTAAEKADLIDVFKNYGFDYLILFDLDPVHFAFPFGFSASAYVKVIDMHKASYVYTGKISKLTKFGGIGTPVSKIGLDVTNVLNAKIFAVK